MASVGDTRITTPQGINNKGKRNENYIEVLTKEIQTLKKSLDDREYVIEDLVLERDQVCDERFALRKQLEAVREKLCDGRNVKPDGIDFSKQNNVLTAEAHALTGIKEVHKKNKKNQDIPANALCRKSRTYEDISTENASLRGKVNELMHVVKQMEEERAQLKKEIFDLNDDVINSLVSERDEILERKLEYMDKLKESQRRVKDLEEERDKAKLLPTEEMEAETPRASPKQECVVATPSELPPASCDSGIGMDLDSFKEYMDTKIDSLIDVKLNKRLAGHVKLEQESYKSNNITNDVTDQEPVSDERECNIIIHGLEETGCKTADQKKVQDIFNAVNVQCGPRTLYRLGIKDESKIRPVMVHLQSKEEKYDILSKLWRLKYARSTNERISITHDYTLEERRLIKGTVDEAKRRNLNENNDGKQDFLWKVRGTPKTKLRIVKIRISRGDD